MSDLKPQAVSRTGKGPQTTIGSAIQNTAMETTEIPTLQQGSVLKGMFICWGLNLLTLALGLLLVLTFIGPLLLIGGIGLVQLLYVRPLYNTYKGKNEEGTCKGLVIAASVTALLNAGCWGNVALGG